jgi:hypothetical protein
MTNMQFKIGDKVMVSSKQGNPVYGFDDNNVYTKIGVSDEKWSYPFAVEITGIHSEGFYQVTDITPRIADPKIHDIRLATEAEIKATEEEHQKDYEAIQKALARGEQMGEVLGRGQVDADRDA